MVRGILSPYLSMSEEKLNTGEHASPPKGYPTDPDLYAVPEFYMFPIDTKEHVHSAISYFSKHEWLEHQNKKKAAKRILAAAKKFDIHVSEDSEVYKAAHA